MDNVAFYILAVFVLVFATLSVILPKFKYAVYSFFAMNLGIALFYFVEKAVLSGILQIVFYTIAFLVFLVIDKKKQFYTKSIMKFNIINFLFIFITSAIALYLICNYSINYEKEYLIKNNLYYVANIHSDYFLVSFLFLILLFVIAMGIVTLSNVKKGNENG